MTWSKLSDDFTDDCWTLSDEAFRLHVEGIVWSNRKLLDCRIPKDDLPRFAKHPDVVQELLDIDWWRDAGDCYLVRHHAVYQRERAKVLRQQEANKENRAQRGKPTPPPRERANESLDQSSHESLDEPSHESLEANDSLNESTNERDRTGQVSYQHLREDNLCAHGIRNGDEPDSWLNGRIACPKCAMGAAS